MQQLQALVALQTIRIGKLRPLTYASMAATQRSRPGSNLISFRVGLVVTERLRLVA